MEPKEPIRYLGIWISLLNDNRYIHRQISCSIKSAVQLMSRKRLTDKQIVSVFNSVLLPQILYRTQLTYLPEAFCNHIMGSY
jgi:hypothetical protein